jgi:putative nucleotidyltransferase with HDIG domain
MALQEARILDSVYVAKGGEEALCLDDRILVVDDSELIRSILAERLTIEGYSCMTAGNGREALDLFYRGKFSLIISDIRMPEMDGLELLRRVKVSNPSMHVIIISAYAEFDMAVEAIRLGAYDFLLKPVNLDLIILRAKRALEKKRLEEEVATYHNNLEDLVDKKTAELRQAYRQLQKAHLDSVKALAEVIEAKDPYTRGHSDRVRKMSLKLGMRLGIDKERLEKLEYGALLHDIGKIGIKDKVLQKQSPLEPEEYQYVQEHPLIGVKILEGMDFFREMIPMVRHHHEEFDGSGYPNGLAGEAIPLEARIIAVCDAFDAMTSRRPHRPMMPLVDVLMEMERGKWTQFDPQMVEIFLNEKIYEF